MISRSESVRVWAKFGRGAMRRRTKVGMRRTLRQIEPHPEARCRAVAQTQDSSGWGRPQRRRHDRELSMSRPELIALHVAPRAGGERDLAIGQQRSRYRLGGCHASWWEWRDRCLT